MRSFLLVMRLIHIVSAVCWVGGTFVQVGFILPAIKRAGPEGGKFMQLLIQRRLPLYLVIAAWSSIISGALLYWYASGGLQLQWIATFRGLLLTIGAASGIGAALAGLLISAPAAARLGMIAARAQAAGGPPTPEQAGEIRSMQERLVRGSHIAAALMAVALVLMVVSR
jgi:hypothetical protein